MDANNSEFNSVFGALSRAVEFIELKAEKTDNALNDLNRERKAYLTATAKKLLTQISPSVRRSLDKTVPNFVTPSINKIFEVNKKIFGIFPRKGYANSLALLQTRLASHLDTVKYGNLRDYDSDIDLLSKEKKSLNIQSNDVIALLSLMQQAQTKGIVLPEELAQQVKLISSRTKSHKNPPYRPAVLSRNTGIDQYVNSDDDFDLLLYLVFDIPTSMRTLLIDAIAGDHRQNESEHQGSFGGGGASGDYSSDDLGSNDGQASSADYSPAIVMGSAAIIGGVAACEIANIATDDRLGYFS